MTDHDAFIAGIIANPADDLPRLAFADWLDDRGEPGDAERAELIRIQCHLSRDYPEHFQVQVPSHHDYENDSQCAACNLIIRYNELLRFHGEAWAAPIPCRDVKTIAPPDYDLPTFRRGFVEEATLTAEDWLRLEDEIVRRHPVRKVRLTTLQMPTPRPQDDWTNYIEKQISTLQRLWPTIEFELPPQDLEVMRLRMMDEVWGVENAAMILPYPHAPR